MSKIIAELEVRDTKVAAAAKGVRAKIEKEMGPLQRMNIGGGLAKGMAILGGVTLAAGAALFAGTKAAINMGDQLSDLSDRTGISAGKLMVMGQAFKDSGMAIEAVGPAVNRLQKAIAGVNEDGEATAGIFGQLGLNMEELNAMSPDAQFRAVGAAISGIADPSQRAAAAMKIFGKSGGELMALFNDADAFSSAAQAVGDQAAIMDRNAALFNDVSRKLELAGLKMQGFFVGVADQVLPVLQPLLDWFASQDLAAQGQAFGRNLAAGIQMIVDGTLLGAFGDGLLIAGAGFVNMITSGINSVIGLLANIPGMGGLGGMQIGQIDTSVWEQNQGNAIADALDKVDSARAAADAKAAEKKTGAAGTEAMAAGGGGAGGGGGNRPSISRMFSTSMGLFVKDPLLAETRRQSTLLEKIVSNTSKGYTSVAGGGAQTGLRFA
ncbi:MAG: hypothetical protein ACOYOL_05160 [Chthoniobacterales bacterium]